tara:strand:- start:11 stop:424 length:414 start_codon:yes stop_codon:yes gene_type:complete
MAGKIVADQLEHSTAGSVDTQFVVNGSAKAWINFNGAGTVASRDSLNISSLTDSAAGDYTISFSNSLVNTNYSFLTCSSDDATSSGVTTGYAYGVWKVGTNASVYSTGSMRFQIGYSSNQTLYDQKFANANVHGDLA